MLGHGMNLLEIRELGILSPRGQGSFSQTKLAIEERRRQDLDECRSIWKILSQAGHSPRKRVGLGGREATQAGRGSMEARAPRLAHRARGSSAWEDAVGRKTPERRGARFRKMLWHQDCG